MLYHYFSKFSLESGTDEAGRGCLAGPVTAAAVILPEDFENTILNDSKQLSEKTREKLRPIIESQAVTFAVTHLHPNEIDEINILNASMKAMQESILKLNQTPEFIIVDGNRSLNVKLGMATTFGKQFSKTEIELLQSIPNQSIIKGDSKYMSIAAASVLAKTHRDEYMLKIACEHPQYDWNNNMAYPTQKHREAIAKYGPSPYHRMSYRLLPDLTLF